MSNAYNIKEVYIISVLDNSSVIYRIIYRMQKYTLILMIRDLIR